MGFWNKLFGTKKNSPNPEANSPYLPEKKNDVVKNKKQANERAVKDRELKAQQALVKEERDKYELSLRAKAEKKAEERERKEAERVNAANAKQKSAQEQEQKAASKAHHVLVDSSKATEASEEETSEKPVMNNNGEAEKEAKARQSEAHELRLIETERERAAERLKYELATTKKSIQALSSKRDQLKRELGPAAALSKLRHMVAGYEEKMKPHQP